MPEDPKGHRGRLSRSGRFLPLVKPATIAPPAPGTELEDEDDDYAEVSIERGVIVETDDPPPDDDDPDDDAVTPPR